MQLANLKLAVDCKRNRPPNRLSDLLHSCIFFTGIYLLLREAVERPHYGVLWLRWGCMKTRFLLPIFLLMNCLGAFAQKDTCRVGIYINSLYDFDLDDKSFMSDFWIWQTYRNDSLQFENVVEVPNSKETDFSHYDLEKKGG